ncbi:uncharacterized protein CHSO_2770 [Chryseobacterium sp. StRB126]|uniref:hypothetical protein n=1 Tax=Chryseobacterium sp. StRB126 TaxID=878220 RepID=UPI0004E98F99|nr:hypothetical protein [Chryseobacterium sp. StRB126]BAP31807.1 uncharacterized protein CHSO_2770 [Chryseobacterium sp. StRB126]
MLAYYEDESLIPPAHAPGYLNLVFYLKGKLKVKGEDEYKYSKHFVAFYLGESGGCKDKSNTYY